MAPLLEMSLGNPSRNSCPKRHLPREWVWRSPDLTLLGLESVGVKCPQMKPFPKPRAIRISLFDGSSYVISVAGGGSGGEEKPIKCLTSL